MLRAFLDHCAPARFAALARPGTLLAFDFDGTLAPLVADPDAAVMRLRTEVLLCAACERYPCVIISGRGRRDVFRRLGRATPLAVIGNHGAEDGATSLADAVALMRTLLAHLAGARALEGLLLEDKGASIALHWHPDASDADGNARAARVLAELATIDMAVRVVPGHRVLNLVPAMLAHKGDALWRIATEQQARRVLFVGDDVTDEDAFALPRPRFVSVRVGHTAQTGARYFVPDQRAVDLILRELVRRRPTSASSSSHASPPSHVPPAP